MDAFILNLDVNRYSFLIANCPLPIVPPIAYFFHYFDTTPVSQCHCPFTFSTFSITSRTQPQPPLTGEIYFAAAFTSSTASAGQQASPASFNTGRSGRSSPI